MRETGPVRKDLTGDDTAGYVGPARVLLGKLKNDMSFNGLSQGQRTLDLPDGTRIIATSMFGRDKLTIVTTAGETQAVEPTTEETKSLPIVHEDDAELQGVDIRSTVICGNSATELAPNGGIDSITAWVYQPGKDLYTVIENLGVGTICTSISDDGMTVVGATYKNVPGVGVMPIPTVWKNGKATLLTTGLDPTLASSYGMASDVSADGRVVVAGLWLYNTLPRALFYNAVWVDGTLAALFPVLAGVGLGGFVEAYRFPGLGCPRTPCVSADGRTLGLFNKEAIGFTFPVGVPEEWVPVNSANATWAVGHQSEGSVSIGSPIVTGVTYQSAIYAIFSGNGTGSYTNPLPAAPACIENDGTVIGLGDFMFRYADGGVTPLMTPGFVMPPLDPGTVNATSSRASRSAMNAVGSSAKGRSLFVTMLTDPYNGNTGGTQAECVVYNDGVPAATIAGKFVNATSRDGTLVGGHTADGGDVGLVAGGWYGKPRIITPIHAVWGGSSGGMTKQLSPPGGPYSWVAGIGSNSLTIDPPPKRLDRG